MRVEGESMPIEFVCFTRGGRAFVPLTDPASLELGDVVHLIDRSQSRMDLVREDAKVDRSPDSEVRVLRVTGLHLCPHKPRGKGHGTAFHRACEAKVRELGFVMASAMKETLNDNPVTTAMHDRLSEVYPNAVHWRDGSYLLL